MKNKHLEERLRRDGLLETIKIVEECEEGTVREISVHTSNGLTGNESLDRELVSYLEKIGVRIVLSSEVPTEIKVYTEKKVVCENALHALVAKRQRTKKSASKIDLKAYKTFRIDDTVYACCPSCHAIIKA